jgi:hypothetical protein
MRRTDQRGFEGVAGRGRLVQQISGHFDDGTSIDVGEQAT